MKKNNFDWVLTQCENYSKKELIEEIYYKCEQIEGKNKKIDQLTNNWNELEEWLKEYLQEESNDEFDYAIDDTLCLILDKIKEIKGDK